MFRRSGPGSAEYRDSQRPNERGIRCNQRRNPARCDFGGMRPRPQDTRRPVTAPTRSPTRRSSGVNARCADTGATKAAATAQQVREDIDFRAGVTLTPLLWVVLTPQSVLIGRWAILMEMRVGFRRTGQVAVASPS